MKDFLEYLIKNIVDKPDEATVAEDTDQMGVVNLSIHVDPIDMGKVIGKSGKIIRALRDLVRVLAVKENRRVNVILTEV
jgi:predicted RNA-binding protein YlqC (UPF0109 family)